MVAQFPNVPLLVALGAALVERLGSGDVADYAHAVNRMGLVVFAYLELADGVNAFRRLLGAGVLGYLVVSLGSELG